MDLNSLSVTIIFVRLLALYFFTVALGASSLTIFVLSPTAFSSFADSALAFAPFVVWLAAAAILWCGAGPLARFILKDTVRPSSSQNFDSSDFFALAFTVVGLLVISDALPSLLQVIAFNLQKTPSWSTFELRASETAVVVALTVKLLLGTLLTLKSDSLSRRFTKR